ncbi:MAG TPA: SpoIIE family protein phosphatase [Terriglobales bacterium]|nr:SpoIIE family protein phosphatase [Terriglobales bacterium]
MASTSYRWLRRRLAGWIPRSGLARFTLYLLILNLFLYVLWKVLLLIPSSPVHTGLRSWVTLLNVSLGALAVLLLLRWVRRRLLWSLRNRLVVTYVFIGVIPVALVVLMALLAGYLFTNQFSAYVINSDLQAGARRLDMLNNTVAGEVAADLRQGRAVSLQSATALAPQQKPEEGFPGLRVTAWYRGQAVTWAAPGTEAAASSLPGWAQNHFAGLTVDPDRGLHLRALSVLPVGGERVTVISDLPLQSSALEKVIGSFGQITLYPAKPTREGAAPPSPAGPAQQRRAPVRIEAGGEEIEFEPVRGERASAVSFGALPAPANRLDSELRLGSVLGTTEWESGKPTLTLLSVDSRVSALYLRLFSAYSGSLGRLGDAVLIVLMAAAVCFGLIELFALLIGLGLTRTMTRSVAELYRATQHINRGDLKHRIQVRSKDQLAALETSFNSMAESLEQLLAEQREKERLQNELAIAQEVQAQLFPAQATHLESLEVHGVCRPARVVSGDYYDFLALGSGKMAIAVGDISGKGISAALLMATIHSAVRAYEFGRMPEPSEMAVAGKAALAAARAGQGGTPLVSSNGIQSPASVLWLLNRHLYHSTPAEKYATLFLGLYDSQVRRLTYSNAGHLPPLVIGADGAVRRLDRAAGLVIGLFDNISHQEASMELHPGDIFLAYSDGVTEPENDFGEFGEERLIEIVRENRSLPLAEISDAVLAAVADWIGSQEQPDDVTVVLARAR